MTIPNLILAVVTITLAMIVLITMGALVVCLFDEKVNNGEIFKIVSPAIHDIVGGFIAILAMRFGRETQA